MLLILLALQQPATQQFPSVRSPGVSAGIATAVWAICSSPGYADRADALRTEQRVQDSVATTMTAEGLARLGCLRAGLQAVGAIGHEGFMMPMGASWSEGAILVLMRSVLSKPDQPVAAELLAVLALAENEPDQLPQIAKAIRASVSAGVATPTVLRACTELSLRVKTDGFVRTCAAKALAAHRDSTWHLLRLAQLAFRDADTVAGARWFELGVEAARDSASRDEVNWHLQWFLSPEEREQALPLVGLALRRWTHDLLAKRDVRDGRPNGARLAEHFARLEYVQVHFVLHLASVIEYPRGIVGVTPENSLPADTARAFCEPGVVPAQPFRDYARWQNRIDDRGIVWMRFGSPVKRIRAAPTCGKPEKRTGLLLANAREAWLYSIDGQDMLLNFEAEKFSGSTEATRLVTGVLGSYLCDVDVKRCGLSTLSIASARAGRIGADAFVKPEDLEAVRHEDRDFVAVATAGDDNTPRGGRNVALRSRLHRLWDPLSMSPIALVTFAVPIRDLSLQVNAGKRTTAFDLELRQWDPVTEQWRDSTFSRRLVIPDAATERSNLVGFEVVPTTPGVTAWSLVATQPGQVRGRAYDVDTPGLSIGPVVLSDLVIGSDAQGIAWKLHEVAIPLAPDNAVDRKAPVSLYFQIKSGEVHPDLRATVALYKVERDVARDTAALQVSYHQEVRAGVTEVAPALDVSRLAPGSYSLEVRLTDARGTVLARRRAALDVY